MATSTGTLLQVQVLAGAVLSHLGGFSCFTEDIVVCDVCLFVCFKMIRSTCLNPCSLMIINNYSL